MPATLAQKLQIKSGQQIAVLNPPQDYLEKLRAELAGIPVTATATAEAGAVLLFVNNLAEAGRLVPEAMRTVKPDGLLWVAYPKGTSGIKTDANRDRLWQALEPTGWRPVRMVALDDIWSAMRFRPAELVK